MLKKIVSIALLINLCLLIIIVLQGRNRRFKVDFFDVGQGDAVYIRTPQDQDILIDGGPSSVVLSKLGDVMPFWDRRVDIIILSHPDADHLTGLVEVLQNYQVGQVYLTGALHSTYEYLSFLELLYKHQEIKKIKVDHRFSVKLSDNAELQFLYPDFDVLNTQIVQQQDIVKDNLNNTSIVVKLVYKDRSFLFTGDIEKEAEGYLVEAQRYKLKSDVLKVPHQGSRTSSSFQFLQAVNPKTAIIMVGADNDFGHPHQDVLERMQSLNIKIRRTDKEGDIILVY